MIPCSTCSIKDTCKRKLSHPTLCTHKPVLLPRSIVRSPVWHRPNNVIEGPNYLAKMMRQERVLRAGITEGSRDEY